MEVSVRYSKSSRPRTYFKQSVPYLVVTVQICCLAQYTTYDVGIMYDKFQGCTVNVQAATLHLNNTRANRVICSQT